VCAMSTGAPEGGGVGERHIWGFGFGLSYTQQKCSALLVMDGLGGGEQNSNHVDQILPFPFWRVSVGQRRSPPGALDVMLLLSLFPLA
jgi:hypothetical protein